MAPSALREALRRLMRGESLDSAETAEAFREVMSGEGAPALVAGLLVALRVKGETPGELAGAARALREAMTVLPVSDPSSLVDTCGTGGGVVPTFNISTAAALVAAGAGLRVAKHGNRSFTTRSGSADVLEALGVAIDIPAEAMGSVLDDAGIVFMFAPTMHPAMRHVGPVRRELGLETVMNMVGPLANPALAGRQVIGVADSSRAELMAGALAELGTRHSLVVHGEPGMDEVSPLGPTTVIEVREGQVRRWTVDPGMLGVSGHVAGDLAGAGPEENARVVEAVLSGKASRAAESAVVLNAAAALLVGGRASTLGAGMDVAREAIASGAARDALDRLRRASRRARP
ncbi:MAG: anthranilate phosphoribosyltransferase, partial [Gemmatimonadota bacterium]|nr:anthranilate phosphoribosyltransferase [Gemmatimonadota bacterium]